MKLRTMKSKKTTLKHHDLFLKRRNFSCFFHYHSSSYTTSSSGSSSSYTTDSSYTTEVHLILKVKTGLGSQTKTMTTGLNVALIHLMEASTPRCILLLLRQQHLLEHDGFQQVGFLNASCLKPSSCAIVHS